MMETERLYYSKTDIMNAFGFSASKSLKMLKLMYQFGYATKIGSSYITNKEMLDSFLYQYRGKNLFI